MLNESKRKLSYILLATSLFLGTSSSFADCPDKTVACTAVAQDGQEVLVGERIINFKGPKVHNVGSVFTALFDGFKCYPCVEGCGHSINREIAACNEDAKRQGYAAGYLDKSSLKGISLGGAIDSILDEAKKTAQAAAQVAAAVKKAKS
jgi:hypothetical protein